MPFNSDTYHANKKRRRALEQLAEARELKARIASGDAYEWEAKRLPTIVSGARLDWHLYLMYRSFKPGRMAPRRAK